MSCLGSFLSELSLLWPQAALVLQSNKRLKVWIAVREIDSLCDSGKCMENTIFADIFNIRVGTKQVDCQLVEIP